MWIDGFQGSRDQHKWRKDRTEEVRKIALKYLPDANMVIRDRNFGIAMQYRDVEAHTFSLDTDIAFFFEEDLVLSPLYLEALIDIEQKTREFKQVGKIAAHGYVRGRGEIETIHGVGVGAMTWGFGLRRKQYEESLPFLNQYYELISNDSYWRRNDESIHSLLLTFGIEVKATSQDAVKGGIARKLRFVPISTMSRLGKYIGRSGEHKSIWSSHTQHKKFFDITMNDSWHVTRDDIVNHLATK